MGENELELTRKCCGRLPHVFPMSKDGTDWVVHCSVCWEGGNGEHPTKRDAIKEWQEEEERIDGECT